MDKPTHPTTAKMVFTALRDLHDRRGTPFVAIKKYIFSNYGVDPAPLMRYMRRYLENAVTEGTVVRTKGVGMAASFRLAPQKPPPRKKPVSDLKPSSGKKPASDQKPSSREKPAVKKKPLDAQKHDLKAVATTTTTTTKKVKAKSNSEKLADETKKKKKATETIKKKGPTKKDTKVMSLAGTLKSGSVTPASVAAISRANGRKISFTAKKIKH